MPLTGETILYIMIAAVVAFAITAFVYAYKTSLPKSLKWLLGGLRFLSLFALFLLIINPKMESVSYTFEKPNLPIVVDVSASIATLADTTVVISAVERLQTDPNLNEAFNVAFYAVGSDFKMLDTLLFTDSQSRLEKVFASLDEVYSDDKAPTILLTDGNQTYGSDYEFAARDFKNRVYPLALGDTTQYLDLKITQLNTNRYSFLKNEFPVEALVVYNGENPVNSKFTLRRGASIVYSENVAFSKENNSKTLNFTLPSSQVGLQRYTAQLEPLEDEKNTENNSKRFAVEVIDQATNILLVSEIVHPDLGALKKSIETNEQRTITIAKPSEALSKVEDYQLVILYQPNGSFSSLLRILNQLGANTLWITGAKTDWNFLNSSQNMFRKDAADVDEEIGGRVNLNYGNYALEDIGFSDFPPLLTSFGDLSVTVSNEVLLQQEINGILTGSPLLATVDINGRKSGILDGENIWKWRSRSYLMNEDFESFDEFMGQLIQYLASNKNRNRLEVTYDSFYYNNTPVLVSAQYFDQNFNFDNRELLEIRAIHQETEEETVVPMLLKNNYYEVDLTSLEPGDYSFTVSVQGEGLSRSGNFTILEFNVEQQFLNADVTKLRRVATYTEGVLFTLDSLDGLIETLISNESFKPVQRSQRKIVPLIDWKYLLAILVFTLAAEWFIRKYNGLI